jgi:broad specificity phosphatase PhoE
MPTAISFVRHGEVYNPDNIFYGRLPGFRLSEKGNYQTGKAAETLNGSRLAAIFSSPPLRARQTAGERVISNPHLRLRISSPL